MTRGLTHLVLIVLLASCNRGSQSSLSSKEEKNQAEVNLAQLPSSGSGQLPNSMTGLSGECLAKWRQAAIRGCTSILAASMSDDMDSLAQSNREIDSIGQTCDGKDRVQSLVGMTAKRVSAIFESGKGSSTADRWCEAAVDDAGVSNGLFPKTMPKASYPEGDDAGTNSTDESVDTLENQVARKKAEYIALGKAAARTRSGSTALVALTFTIFNDIPILCGVVQRGPSSLSSYKAFSLFLDDNDFKILDGDFTPEIPIPCPVRYDETKTTPVDKALLEDDLIPSKFVFDKVAR